MEFARIYNEFYCGIDLHARTMFVCVMNKAGEILFHRNMRNDFTLLMEALKPYLKDIAIGVESTYNWYL